MVIDKFPGANTLSTHFETDTSTNTATEEGAKTAPILVGNLKIRIEYSYEYGTTAVYAAVSIKPVVKREEVGADVTAVEGPEVGGYNGWEEMIISRSTLVAR